LSPHSGALCNRTLHQPAKAPGGSPADPSCEVGSPQGSFASRLVATRRTLMTQHRAETLSRLLRCTLDFRVGSIATEPSGSSVGQCPLCSQQRPKNCRPRSGAMGHERTSSTTANRTAILITSPAICLRCRCTSRTSVRLCVAMRLPPRKCTRAVLGRSEVRGERRVTHSFKNSTISSKNRRAAGSCSNKM
jgi:hypothetical protein